MNKKGFTLAEVLITLTVIGVISALTIPNILQNVQDAQNKAAFKRIYSDLEQATKRLIQDSSGTLVGIFNDPDGGGPLTIHDSLRDRYLPYLSYVVTCNDNSTTSPGPDGNGDYYVLSNCWSKYTYYLNKSFGADNEYKNSQLVLNNGAFLDFYIINNNCASSALYPAYNVCGYINIDVNGIKSPNQNGKDIFAVYLTRNGIVPLGVDTDIWSRGTCIPTATDEGGYGYSCATNVLQNKDY